MGKKGRQKKGTITSVAKASGDKPAYTVDQLLDRVDEYMEDFQLELAHKFATRALSMAPNDVRALEAMAVVLLESGDPDNAYQCLRKAVEYSPEQGYSKYMYLGQLMGGAEAVQCIEKGISLLEREIAQGGENADNLRSQVTTAWCTIAELFMTDLCDLPDAEQKCGAALERAVAHDDQSFEAWQTMASYLISAQKPEEAKAAMEKSLALWFKDSGDESESVDEMQALPAYDFRINTVRLLAELGIHQPAFKILERLRKEDDEVVDTWYLAGWLAHITNDTDFAIECLDKARQLFVKVGCDDEQMLAHIEELLGEYQAKGLYTPGEGQDADAEADWVDQDEDDEMEMD